MKGVSSMARIFGENSRRKIIAKSYLPENFLHDQLINDEIKAGNLRALFPDGP